MCVNVRCIRKCVCMLACKQVRECGFTAQTPDLWLMLQPPCMPLPLITSCTHIRLRATHVKVCFFELPLAHNITSRTSSPRVAMDTIRATWLSVCTGSNLSLSCMLSWTVYEGTASPDRLDSHFSSEALQSFRVSKLAWMARRKNGVTIGSVSHTTLQ